MSEEEDIDRKKRRFPRTSVLLALTVFLIIILAIVAAISFYTVDLGYVAVIIDPITRSISAPVVGPTFGLRAPWTSIIQGYTGVEAVDMFYTPPRDFPAIDALTNDGVKVSIDLTIRYQVVPEQFALLVASYPRLNHEEDYIVTTSRQIAREIAATYKMLNLFENREIVARNIENNISAALRKDPLVGAAIKLLAVNMRDIILPNEILTAINEKVAAQQKVLTADFTRQATLIEANASAQKTIIEAEAQATSIKLVANAQATSIISLANSTSVPASKVIEYFFYLQSVERATMSGKTAFIISTTGITPLIDISTQP